jgi:hypothetical protein
LRNEGRIAPHPCAARRCRPGRGSLGDWFFVAASRCQTWLREGKLWFESLQTCARIVCLPLAPAPSARHPMQFARRKDCRPVRTVLLFIGYGGRPGPPCSAHPLSCPWCNCRARTRRCRRRYRRSCRPWRNLRNPTGRGQLRLTGSRRSPLADHQEPGLLAPKRPRASCVACSCTYLSSAVDETHVPGRHSAWSGQQRRTGSAFFTPREREAAIAAKPRGQ